MKAQANEIAKPTNAAEASLTRIVWAPIGWLAILVVLPLMLGSFLIGVMSSLFIWVIVGIGMVVLVGYSGQVSIGHAAFLAMGAYAEALLIKYGIPFPLTMIFVAFSTLVIGILIGLPSLRFSGLYLAMGTLAFALIVEALIGGVDFTGGRAGMSVESVGILGHSLSDDLPMYYFSLGVTVAIFWLARNLVRSRTGRAWWAIRDSEIAAATMGIGIARYKTIAFAFSAATTGVAGALLAHKVGYLAPDGFTLQQSIEMLILVVVGGLGSLMGAVYGAMFIVFVPVALSLVKDHLPNWLAELPGLEAGFFGFALMLVILFQPSGLAGGVDRAVAALKRSVARGDVQ